MPAGLLFRLVQPVPVAVTAPPIETALGSAPTPKVCADALEAVKQSQSEAISRAPRVKVDERAKTLFMGFVQEREGRMLCLEAYSPSMALTYALSKSSPHVGAMGRDSPPDIG